MVAFIKRISPPMASSMRFTNIITPADLNIPMPSQLPGKHAVLQPVSSAMHYHSTMSFTVYSQVPLLHMGEVRKSELNTFPKGVRNVRRSQDSNPGPSDPESDALTTRPFRSYIN